MQEQVLDILRRTRRRMRAADAAAATVVLTATAALAAAAIELAWSLPDSSHVWGLAFRLASGGRSDMAGTKCIPILAA